MNPNLAQGPQYQITLKNVIGITLLTALIFVLGGVIVVQIDPGLFTPERSLADQMLWLSFLIITGVVASTGYVIGTRTAAGWGVVGLTSTHPRWYLIAVAVAAVLFFVGERIDHVFGFGIFGNTRQTFGPTMESQVGMISMFAVMVVVLPIALEIYFRGVLFNYLRAKFPLEAAIGLSSGLYALVYYNPDIPVYLSYGLIHGAAFAILFARSGSLWTAIIANGTLQALLLAKIAWA